MKVIDHISGIIYQIDDLRVIKIFGTCDYDFLLNKNEDNQTKSYGFVYGKSYGNLADGFRKIVKCDEDDEGNNVYRVDGDRIDDNDDIWTEIPYHKVTHINEPPEIIGLLPPYRYIQYTHLINTKHVYIIFFKFIDPKYDINEEKDDLCISNNYNFVPLSSITDLSDELSSRFIYQSLQLFIKYYELTRSLLQIIDEDLILISLQEGKIIILNLFLSLFSDSSEKVIAQSYPKIPPPTNYPIKNYFTTNKNIILPISSLMYHPLLTLILTISSKVGTSVFNTMSKMNGKAKNNKNNKTTNDDSNSNDNSTSNSKDTNNNETKSNNGDRNSDKSLSDTKDNDDHNDHNDHVDEVEQESITIFNINDIFTSKPISRVDNYIMEFGDILLYSNEHNISNKLIENFILLDSKEHYPIYDDLEFSFFKPKIVDLIVRSKYHDDFLYNQNNDLSVDNIITNIIIRSKTDKLTRIFHPIYYSKPILSDSYKNYRNIKISNILKNIYRIDFCGCNINDYNLSPIKKTFKKLKNLRYFMLDNNNIGMKSIKFMCKSFGFWENLRQYHLNNCNIGNDGIRYLANNLSSLCCLSDLQISCNWIGNDHLTHLFRYLSLIGCKTLNLSGNDIKDIGLKMLSKYPDYISQLQEIDLSDNPITTKGLASLNREDIHFNNLRVLKLSKTKTMMNFIETLIKLMEKMPLLTELDLSRNEMEFPKMEILIRSIKYVPKLEKLILNDNLLRVRGIDLISSNCKYCPNFKTLNISKNDMKSDGFHFLVDNLKYLPKLENLDISHNEIDESMTSLFVANLKYITNLVSLNLSENYLSKTCIAELCDNNGWLPKLKYLDISCMNLYEDSVMTILKNLGNFPSLEILCINATYSYYIIDYSNPIYDPYRDRISVVSGSRDP